MQLTVRVAEEGDFPQIGVVDAAARRQAYTPLFPPEALADVTPQAQARIWSQRAMREKETHRMLVAVSDGNVVGYSYAGPGDDPLIGDLYALFVHPDYHGTVVAQQLLDGSRAVLRGLGYQRMLLWVVEGNMRAIRFYEKNGWRHDGTRRVSKRGPDSLRYLLTDTPAPLP